MNLLTDDEINALWVDPGKGRSMWFARAIIAATLQNLAQGVSVKPDTSTYSNYNDYPAYTPEQLQTAIAAARVQALEEAAKVCESEYDNWDNERPLRICATAIRALIGKEST